MKKILVGVDGSIAAVHAAKKALELAKAMKPSLTLIHVQPAAFASRAGSRAETRR